MRYNQLGRTGAQVSRLALGTMNFGWHTDEAASQQIMNRSLDVGIKFLRHRRRLWRRRLGGSPRPLVRR
jgi:predicted aldo/keto reductase-like oxidoreductase